MQGNEDDDILFGGFGGDTIDAGAGHNIVLGDGGFDRLRRADGNLPRHRPDRQSLDLRRSAAATRSPAPAATTSSSAAGRRHHRRRRRQEHRHRRQRPDPRPRSRIRRDFGGHPLTLGQIETIAFGIGGADVITTGTGRDIVLGGHLNDTITVSDLDGRLVPTTTTSSSATTASSSTTRDLNSADIDEIASLSTTFAGGADTITSTGGDDIIIGGRFGDNDQRRRRQEHRHRRQRAGPLGHGGHVPAARRPADDHRPDHDHHSRPTAATTPSSPAAARTSSWAAWPTTPHDQRRQRHRPGRQRLRRFRQRSEIAQRPDPGGGHRRHPHPRSDHRRRGHDPVRHRRTTSSSAARPTTTSPPARTTTWCSATTPRCAGDIDADLLPLADAPSTLHPFRYTSIFTQNSRPAAATT